jgi:hypothetical protein
MKVETGNFVRESGTNRILPDKKEYHDPRRSYTVINEPVFSVGNLYFTEAQKHLVRFNILTQEYGILLEASHHIVGPFVFDLIQIDGQRISIMNKNLTKL